MLKHEIDSRKRIGSLTKEELISFFAELDYRDPIGHPLANCLDFQILIAIYFESRGYVESLAAFRRSVCDKLDMDYDDTDEDVLLEIKNRN
jgi:hypothetical protein